MESITNSAAVQKKKAPNMGGLHKNSYLESRRHTGMRVKETCSWINKDSAPPLWRLALWQATTCPYWVFNEYQRQNLLVSVGLLLISVPLWLETMWEVRARYLVSACLLSSKSALHRYLFVKAACVISEDVTQVKGGFANPVKDNAILTNLSDPLDKAQLIKDDRLSLSQFVQCLTSELKQKYRSG